MENKDEQITVSAWSVRVVYRLVAVVAFGLGAGTTALLMAVVR